MRLSARRGPGSASRMPVVVGGGVGGIPGTCRVR